jgi:hypothetical protein
MHFECVFVLGTNVTKWNGNNGYGNNRNRAESEIFGHGFQLEPQVARRTQ